MKNQTGTTEKNDEDEELGKHLDERGFPIEKKIFERPRSTEVIDRVGRDIRALLRENPDAIEKEMPSHVRRISQTRVGNTLGDLKINNPELGSTGEEYDFEEERLSNEEIEQLSLKVIATYNLETDSPEALAKDILSISISENRTAFYDELFLLADARRMCGKSESKINKLSRALQGKGQSNGTIVLVKKIYKKGTITIQDRAIVNRIHNFAEILGVSFTDQ